MTKLIDLSGQRFGKLVVLAGQFTRRDRRTYWRCQCDCGSGPVEVWAPSLRRGNTRSCGCLHKDVAVRWTKHGQEGTRLYRIWQGMKRRCFNASSRDYPRYGGRGVSVCPDWREDFAAFASAVGQPPSDSHTIDRIDNNRGYEPGNVRWATAKQQANNTAGNHRLTLGDETLTLAQWAERTGLSSFAIRGRLRLGWPVERILSEPKRGTSGKGRPVRPNVGA